jgi:hypothetical protein
MTTNVAPGSHWRRKRDDGGEAKHGPVHVVRVTGGGKVVLQRSDGQKWDMPMSLFIGTYAPDGATGECQRCGSLTLRYPTDKYCLDCMRLIGRVRNARRQQEEPVLTTTSPTIVEERHRPVPTPPPPPAESTPATAQRWRITAKRVIIDTVVVEGATVIDALAQFETEVPDGQITDVHLLDT